MIYFYVYPSAFQNPGGGEIVLMKTKQALERLGAEAVLFDQWRHRFQKGDLLHVFGSVKEALGLMETAKSKGVQIVLNPIIWYTWESAFRIAYHFQDRFACVLRQLVKTVFPFAPSERKRMMELADAVLAGSAVEARQIGRYFLIPHHKIKVVHYGVDERYDKASKDWFVSKYGLERFILCAGRIEPRKNQLNLIRALRGTGLPLVLIGEPVSRHLNYYQQCIREAEANVRFLGSFPNNSKELCSAYAACDVFALPSWFETPGLAALEAGLAGAKIVITREGATREYFKDFVRYVNPGNVRDIRRQVMAAWQANKSDALRVHIGEHFSWDRAAKETLAVYKRLGNHYLLN